MNLFQATYQKYHSLIPWRSDVGALEVKKMNTQTFDIKKKPKLT